LTDFLSLVECVDFSDVREKYFSVSSMNDLFGYTHNFIHLLKRQHNYSMFAVLLLLLKKLIFTIDCNVVIWFLYLYTKNMNQG